jgi:SPP1 gp7 family putative phage head morphogenesis protein
VRGGSAAPAAAAPEPAPAPPAGNPGRRLSLTDETIEAAGGLLGKAFPGAAIDDYGSFIRATHGDREIDLNFETAHADDPIPAEAVGGYVTVEFRTAGGDADDPTPPAARGGSLSLARGLAALSAGFAKLDLAIAFRPSDDRRARRYSESLAAAGYIPLVLPPDAYGVGVEFWVPAARVPAATHAKLVKKYQTWAASRESVPARHSEFDVHAFAWEDWKPDGELMVSPGGRKLRRETWERLKGKAGPAAAGRKPAKEVTDITRVRQARTRAQGPEADAVAALAAKIERGDPEAARQAQQRAAEALPRVAAQRPAPTPADAATLKAGFDAALGRTPGGAVTRKPGLFGEVEAAVENFLSGLVGEPNPEGIAGRVGAFANALAGLGARGLWYGVKTLAKFAGWVAKTGARAAWAGLSSETARPFLKWAGTIAVAGAIMASPLLAVKFGLIHWFPAVFTLPVAAMATRLYIGRKQVASNVPPPMARNSESFGEKDVALAGPDGERAHALLAAARGDVTDLFRDTCRRAVTRLVEEGNVGSAAVLFSDDELADLAAGVGRVMTAADLLGRARVRRRAELAERREKGEAFAELPDDPFHDFAEPVPPLRPEAAVEWMRARVPTLDGGLDRYGGRLDRYATAQAIAADEVLLDKIRKAVIAELEGGGDATPDVEAILDAAGVGARDSQYSEMIARTNAMQAYTEGASAELRSPEMAEAFPAWQYSAVRDDRARPHHAARDGKYYPAGVSFAEVRGQKAEDVANCRCNFVPVHRSMMDGIRLEDRW